MTDDLLIKKLNPLLQAGVLRQLEAIAAEKSQGTIDGEWLQNHVQAQVTRYDMDGCECELLLESGDKGKEAEALYAPLLDKLKKLRCGSLETDHGKTILKSNKRGDFTLWLHLAGVLPMLHDDTLEPREASRYTPLIAQKILRENGERDPELVNSMRVAGVRAGYQQLFADKSEREEKRKGATTNALS